MALRKTESIDGQIIPRSGYIYIEICKIQKSYSHYLFSVQPKTAYLLLPKIRLIEKPKLIIGFDYQGVI